MKFILGTKQNMTEYFTENGVVVPVTIVTAGPVKVTTIKAGGKDGYKYPNTILEMIDLINNPESDQSIVAKSLEWIYKVDPTSYMIELSNKIKYLIEKYPEIHFLILPWHNSKDGNMFTKENFLKQNIIEIREDSKLWPAVNSFLQQNKLHVWHKAKGWNGNYEFNYREDHASVEGHQRIANMVINHIKKLENSKLIKTRI